MLPYVKNYLIKTYVLSPLPALIFVVVATLATGRPVLFEPWGMLTAVALVMLGTFFVGKWMADAAIGEAAGLVNLFSSGCDPQAFVDGGGSIASRMKPPFDEGASWYASYYCLALLDIGRTREAAKLADDLRISVDKTRKPATRAAICLHMEPPVRRLLGSEAALKVLDHAEIDLDSANVPDEDGHRRYLSGERSILVARRDGDDERLVELLSRVRQASPGELRARVEAAWEEAEAEHRLGHVDRERSCLRFVVERGNLLSCVSKAHDRLNELETVSG